MRTPVRRVLVIPAAAAIAATALVSGVGTASTGSDRCEAIADAQVARTTITETRFVEATDRVGEHCLVDGFVTTPGDEVVESNQVGFRVGLPTEWNQDFYFQGVGGLAGNIGDLTAGLARGYASASTDTGHQAPSLDGRWALGNRPKQIDYAHRGVHVATVAAKEIADVYYGRSQRYAVFNGCSNGGRQALMEAQRYPDDYDGVISQAPAFAASDTITSWIWQTQAQLREPGAWLSPQDLAKLSDATLSQNDHRDGLVDELISEPRRASFQPHQLAAGTLTPSQLETVRAIYAGPAGPDGEQLAPGHPIGHEEGWASWITGSAAPVPGSDGRLAFPQAGAPLGYLATHEFLRYFVFDDPDYQITDFDFDTDLPAMEKLGSLLDATDPDLREFEAQGGKLLVTHGWSDDALNAMASVDYRNEVVKTMGPDVAEKFYRLFMVPGMFHCRGGPGPNTYDALTAMEKWVRDGHAPTSMIATNHDSGRSRPLCAFPGQATYSGRGSIDDAENYRCTGSR